MRVAISALDYEYHHDVRTQSPRLNSASLQLDVRRRGLGPERTAGAANTAEVFCAYVPFESIRKAAVPAGLACLVGTNTT